MVWAGTYRSPDRDASCLVAGNCVDGQGIYVSAQLKDGACKPEWLGVISWDLRMESGQWQSASLRLSAYEQDGAGPCTFNIYPVTTEEWNETGSAPGYDANTILASVTDDLTDGELTFVSDDLGAYFKEKVGGKASIVVALVDGCAGGNAFARFEDTERSSSRVLSEPDLIFWGGPVVNGTPTISSTAVSVSTLSAHDSGYSIWLLLAGMVLMVVAGIFYWYSWIRI